MKTLRLIYPQWQGGIISQLVPECRPEDATQGYALGARLLDFLAPRPEDQTAAVVPVSMQLSGTRETKHGISDFDAIAEQTRAALAILERESPDRVVTLGGECSVSAPAFTYLAKKYEGKTAIVWIDAHPDINKPGDAYAGYHAMALSACLGEAGPEISAILPAAVKKSRVFLAGLRAREARRAFLADPEAPRRLDVASRLRDGMYDGHLQDGIVSVNTGIDLVREIKPAGDIVRELMADFL